MNKIIITCNAGSTNYKLARFEAKGLEKVAQLQTHSETETLAWLSEAEKQGIRAIGHRVVHGGGKYTEPTIITPETLHDLAKFIPLAPLHQPAALKLIAEITKLYPSVPQIACFDTAFHHTIPELEARLPLPAKFYDEGVRRYGFHGLSYQYITSILPEKIGNSLANSRVVVAHLGGGSSACAMKNCKSIASTMGFSTLDGLMMGTRCGALDVGVILHLLQHKNMSVTEVENLLYKNSGLLGVSGISGEMRDLLASNQPDAKTAIELYCHFAAKQIAGLLPAIGGLDALIFTGGIGEHATIVREKICNNLAFLGNFSVYTIPTNEELMIAQACKKTLCN
jgi:acetate kinase